MPRHKASVFAATTFALVALATSTLAGDKEAAGKEGVVLRSNATNGYGPAGDQAPALGKAKTLYAFSGGADGNSPVASLIFDESGNLYGTTTLGGLGYGVVFELTPTQKGTWTEKILYEFKGGSDGEYPSCTLIFDSRGNLYGTTAGEGYYNYGTIFELTRKAHGEWTEEVIHRFTGGADGGNPHPGLISDGHGNFYGTTFSGARVTSDGTVFEVIPTRNGGWKQKVIYSFQGYPNDGLWPSAGLVFGRNGHLYGTTWYGGNHDRGSVFEMTPNANGSWRERLIHSFQGPPDGEEPQASLVLDQGGNLYGTTQFGGDPSGSEAGVVFRLAPGKNGKWSEKILHTFTISNGDGEQPWDAVLLDAAGDVYGTTSWAGTIRRVVQALAVGLSSS